jgi:hypothetical protein
MGVTDIQGESAMGENMSYPSRQEYFRTQGPRYRKASRAEKGRILDEACVLFGLHRKSLIRALNASGKHPAGKAGRPALYDAKFLLKALKTIWLAAGQPCSKRLAALLPVWLPHYEHHYGALDGAVHRALERISAATIDRLLAPVRAKKGRGATCSTARLQGQIPIRTRFQEVDGPGWIEADTVAHCGQSLAGAFVWSLTLTDIWSGWTENRAVWNKDHRQIVARVREIEQALPFDLLGFDSDNGSEFITHALVRFLRERPVPVEFTRSRPYHKNDNAHVEQRQWTHVRQLFGYDRFEDKRLVAALNDLYANEWRLLQNFYLPTMRLVSKRREGGRLVRHHSAPATPYARLMQSGHLSEEEKQKLRRQYEDLDPFTLRQAIERKLKEILRLAHTGKKIPAARNSSPQRDTSPGVPASQRQVPGQNT